MSTSEKPVFKYVQPEVDASGRRIAKGTLKVGLKIEGEYQKEFVLAEASAGDLLDAEQQASTVTPLNFNTALLARQLQSLGSYQGPFTLGMLRSLKAFDFNTLREAQAEFDLAGELAQ